MLRRRRHSRERVPLQAAVPVAAAQQGTERGTKRGRLASQACCPTCTGACLSRLSCCCLACPRHTTTSRRRCATVPSARGCSVLRHRSPKVCTAAGTDQGSPRPTSSDTVQALPQGSGGAGRRRRRDGRSKLPPALPGCAPVRRLHCAGKGVCGPLQGKWRRSAWPRICYFSARCLAPCWRPDRGLQRSIGTLRSAPFACAPRPPHLPWVYHCFSNAPRYRVGGTAHVLYGRVAVSRKQWGEEGCPEPVMARREDAIEELQLQFWPDAQFDLESSMQNPLDWLAELGQGHGAPGGGAQAPAVGGSGCAAAPASAAPPAPLSPHSDGGVAPHFANAAQLQHQQLLHSQLQSLHPSVMPMLALAPAGGDAVSGAAGGLAGGLPAVSCVCVCVRACMRMHLGPLESNAGQCQPCLCPSHPAASPWCSPSGWAAQATPAAACLRPTAPAATVAPHPVAFTCNCTHTTRCMEEICRLMWALSFTPPAAAGWRIRPRTPCSRQRRQRQRRSSSYTSSRRGCCSSRHTTWPNI